MLLVRRRGALLLHHRRKAQAHDRDRAQTDAQSRGNPQIALIVDHYEEEWSYLAYVLVHGAGHIVDETNEYMLALRNLRDKYPQYRTMTLGFDKNPMVRIDAQRLHVWGERFKPPPTEA